MDTATLQSVAPHVLTPRATVKPRLVYVDWLRAIGITLVVYGHSQGVPPVAYRLIYSFHMPLFFFLSGLTLGPEKCRIRFGEFFKATCRSLLPPYLIFALIGYITWATVIRHYTTHFKDFSLWRPLWAIVYGSGTQADQLQPIVLWFFPCLVSAQLLFWFVAQSQLWGRIALVIGAATAGFLARNLVLPWELESAFLALSFIWLGYEFGWRYNHRVLPVPFALGLVVMAGPATYWLSQINGGIDMRISQIGQPFLFFLTALLGIATLYGVSNLLPPSKLAEQVSKATIVIFPLHPHLFWGLAAFYMLALKQASLRQNPWLAIVASLAVVALLTWVAPRVQKFIAVVRTRCLP